MEPQRQRKEVALVWMGLLGSAIVALCCSTPGFVVLLGVVGLGAAPDDVLLPALAMFVVITVYGLLSETTIDHEKKPYSSVR